MPRKYSAKAQETVHKAMRKYQHGTLESGRSHTKVKSRKQAIAIGLSEAREKGQKVPTKRAAKRTTTRTARRTAKRK